MEINNNKLPKRKPKKTFRSVTGYFPSKKNDRSLFFESMLEKTLFITLEFDDNVLTYLEQPVKINYKLKNRNTSYHPDCLVNYKKGKSKLIEVKYSTELLEKKDKLEIKFNQARLYAEQNDLIFDTFDERCIDVQTLRNMEFLYSFAFHPSDSEKEQIILEILKENSEVSVSELLTSVTENRFEQAKYLPYVWKLVFDKLIKLDYQNIQINMNSQLRLNDE
tara:strand:- start:336 stop:998 length:663 start_codon:yes stop_codon:yes gene_type:complete